MSPTIPTAASHDDAVERLIRRILQRGVAGTLITGALGGCVRQELEDPGPDSDRASVRGSDADASGGSPGEADAAVAPPGSDAGRAPPAPALPVLDAGREGPRPGPDGGVTCPTGTRGELQASGLGIAGAYDYVAVRRAPGAYREPSDAGVETWTNSRFMVLSESGKPCATASEAACSDKVALHPEEVLGSFCVQACSEISIVTTRGDEVARWTSDAQLRELLGSVDSSDEALLWGLRGGYWDLCTKQVGDTFEVVGTHYKETCPVVYERVTLGVSPTGALERRSAEELRAGPLVGACIGRIPAALRSPGELVQGSSVGTYLAKAAHLEAASVHAFERLARELAAHGAPDELIAAAESAARDEVRHAQLMGALAERHGVRALAAEVDDLPVRSLEEIALENAVEGCVRETFGAVVGAFQAQHARDGAVRRAMQEIARDEARHAGLSQRVHVWCSERLDAEARARLYAAQRSALEQLEAECASELRVDARTALGLPTAQLSRALLRELDAALFQKSTAVA